MAAVQVHEDDKDQGSNEERTLVRYTLMILLELDNETDVFKDHTSAEYSEANVLFWRECNKFKHMAKRGETAKNLKKHALNIYGQFIDASAQFPVKLDDKVKSKLKKKIDENQIQGNLFQEAVTEIETMMASGAFPKFAKKMQETVANSWKLALSKLSTNEIGKLMYMNWFMQCPELMPMFRSDLAKNGSMVITVVESAINLLDDLKKLIPKLVTLGKKHVTLGATPEYFTALGKALVQTLAETLENEWTHEMEVAWTTTYNMMSNVMLHSMERTNVDNKSEGGHSGTSSKNTKLSNFMVKTGLPLILEMELKNDVFKGELVYYYKEEHISFWREVYEFREHALDAEESKKKKSIEIKAKALYSKYLAPNAQFQLKLPPGVKQEIANRVQRELFQATLFDEAWERVEQMMEERPFPRFSQKVGMNIQQPWDDLTEKLSTEKVGKIMFMNFFMKCPEVMPLFNKDIEKHGAMLAGMIDMAIQSIGDLKALIPTLVALGERHRKFGALKPEHFEFLCESLIATLRDSLKGNFTEDMEKAWKIVFTFLSQVMLNAMKRAELEESEKGSTSRDSGPSSPAKKSSSDHGKKDQGARFKDDEASETGSNISDESSISTKKKKKGDNCLVM